MLVIAGGGTGGHVYPGVAIAEAWQARFPAGGVTFVGTERGLESRIVPALGLPFEVVPARRLKNAGIAERARTLAATPAVLMRATAVLRRLRPEVVLGVGGYVSGPVLLAAALTGVPCAVAEQNALPGLTNRILGRFVRRIYTAFPQAAGRLPARKVRMLGNPVRDAVREAGARSKSPEAGDGIHILVMGGSQGARTLNQKLPEAFGALRASAPALHIVHQTGRGKDAEVRAAYDAAGMPEVQVVDFIDDVAGALVRADLVVARAGATTVAELACVGRPAVFVPFPYAADDHQAENAAALVEAGAARMIRESEMEGTALLDLLTDVLASPETLREMGSRARALGRPRAAEAIVDDLCDLAGLEAP